MRLTTLCLALLLCTLGLAAVGCGSGEEKAAAPETVEGTLTTETTTTETETTDTTETGTTETTETTTTETQPPAGEGDPAAGKEIFLGASACGGCHTLADAGTSGTVGPNLDETKPSVELVVDRVTNGQGAMPSFSGTLTSQQIADVAAYVSQATAG